MVHESKKLKNTHVVKMDKKRLHFLKQINLLIVPLREECKKERMTAEELIFLLLNLQKKKKLR